MSSDAHQTSISSQLNHHYPYHISQPMYPPPIHPHYYAPQQLPMIHEPQMMYPGTNLYPHNDPNGGVPVYVLPLLFGGLTFIALLNWTPKCFLRTDVDRDGKVKHRYTWVKLAMISLVVVVLTLVIPMIFAWMQRKRAESRWFDMQERRHNLHYQSQNNLYNHQVYQPPITTSVTNTNSERESQ